MAMSIGEEREYLRQDCIIFLKTHEQWGGLSNMAGGFPIEVNGIRIRTAEALFQACRFPHLPEIQQLIIDQKSPMSAKMKSRPYREKTRSDWYDHHLDIMYWCLQVKLAQNWVAFGDLLEQTGNSLIMEESHRDTFWGASAIDDHTLKGRNILGCLLMGLRARQRSDADSFRAIEPLPIDDFLLLGKNIGPVARNDLGPTQHPLFP